MPASENMLFWGAVCQRTKVFRNVHKIKSRGRNPPVNKVRGLSNALFNHLNTFCFLSPPFCCKWITVRCEALPCRKYIYFLKAYSSPLHPILTPSQFSWVELPVSLTLPVYKFIAASIIIAKNSKQLTIEYITVFTLISASEYYMQHKYEYICSYIQ